MNMEICITVMNSESIFLITNTKTNAEYINVDTCIFVSANILLLEIQNIFNMEFEKR